MSSDVERHVSIIIIRIICCCVVAVVVNTLSLKG